MGFTNIKTKSQGFTIVELLIVVVVIAILAAITIVSYNGITNQANASAAASTAASLQKKAELYFADKGSYPTAMTQLTTSADSGEPYYLASGSVKVTTGAPASGTGKDTVRVLPCTGGLRIDYYDFEAGSGFKSIPVGTQTACGTTPNSATWAAAS